MRPGVCRGRVLETLVTFLNFRVPTEAISELCKKKEETPEFFGPKPAVFLVQENIGLWAI